MSKLRILVSTILILGGIQVFFSHGLSFFQVAILGIELILGIFSLSLEIKNRK